MTDSTVRIDGNTLRLPGGVAVRFVRTLRLPETGTHPLPPGLGEFPVRRVTDYPDTVPEEWRARGGVMLPVYLREAMWLSFGGTAGPPRCRSGVGKVCAVSGEPWSDRLSRKPQNYVVLPRQPWLDGINSGKGTVRQFVAVPLGPGRDRGGPGHGRGDLGRRTAPDVPAVRRGLAEWLEAERHRAELERVRPRRRGLRRGRTHGGGRTAALRGLRGAAAAMGLGVGGSMRQEVYRDDRPFGDWAEQPAGRVFVHLVTPPEWRRITGEAPPPSPVDRAAYTRAGLPWFDYYDQEAGDLAPTEALEGVQPVGDWLGDDHEPWQDPAPHQVKPLKDAPGKPVEDGDW